MEIEKELRYIALQQKRREEIDALKKKNKESKPNGFSGKQKKQQLRDKKIRIQQRKMDFEQLNDEYAPHFVENGEDEEMSNEYEVPRKTDCRNLQLTVAMGSTRNEVDQQLATYFVKETKEQIYSRIAKGRDPLDFKKRTQPLYAKYTKLDSILDHPIRPIWSYQLTKRQVEDGESMYFDDWLGKIHTTYPEEELNHFEHNLEVWRQLWRVLERSDKIVLVADIRNPLLHIPQSLYHYVVEKLKKPLIIVLNKVDIVPPEALQQWIDFLAKLYPECTLVPFSSRSNEIYKENNLAARRKILSVRLVTNDPAAIDGAKRIFQACGVNEQDCNALVAVEEADLEEDVPVIPKKQSRRKKSKKKTLENLDNAKPSCYNCGLNVSVVRCSECSDGFDDSFLCLNCHKEFHSKSSQHRFEYLEKEEKEIEQDENLVIGLVGHPNVGKSSVLNALAGRKAASVSSTPGHTKRFQTIVVGKNISVCDCPGLVFPSTGTPRYLQELFGLYPFAQVREPFSSVRFLAEHLDLESILNLKPRTVEFEGILEELAWTPSSICEALAEKKGYKTDRRGRPDQHRAGLELIRDCIEGVLPLYFLPFSLFEETHSKLDHLSLVE